MLMMHVLVSILLARGTPGSIQKIYTNCIEQQQGAIYGSPLMVCFMIRMLGLYHAHVLVHVDSCHDLSWLVCGVPVCTMECPPSMEACLACKPGQVCYMIHSSKLHPTNTVA